MTGVGGGTGGPLWGVGRVTGWGVGRVTGVGGGTGDWCGGWDG